MVGEMRDTGNRSKIAVQGGAHRVTRCFSTLHTNDAASTISRMLDMGVDPFMVASSTLLVSAQRLVRRLCPHCREEYTAKKGRLIELGLTEEEAASKPKLYRPKGCGRCSQGYSGRFALLETLPMTEKIKRLIIDGASALELRRQSIEDGMITLRRAALLNALRGKTSIEEVLRVTLSDTHRRGAAAAEAEAEAEA